MKVYSAEGPGEQVIVHDFVTNVTSALRHEHPALTFEGEGPFQWGLSNTRSHGGSYDLAWEILCDIFDRQVASTYYLLLGDEIIGNLNPDLGWRLSENSIRSWLMGVPQ